MKYDICVFGGCAMDRMYYKDSNGDIPSNPSVIVPGGKGANQAVAASRAGANVVMISRIGKDDIGEKILENLVYNNILIHNVEVVDGLSNDCADILIDEKNKDNSIKRYSGAIDSFTPDMIDKYRSVLFNSKIVVAQMKVPKEVSVELIEFCYRNEIPLIITPCRPNKLIIGEDNNEELINKITYITCNKKECMTIFETDNIEECVTRYPNKLIVTLGSEGLIYHNGTNIVKLDPIYIRNIEDTTGAGDTFNGNFAASLCEGYSLHDAIVRAQYASAMKIRSKTAQDGMPYKDELDNFLINHYLEENDYSKEFELAYSSIKKAYDLIKKNNMVKVMLKSDRTFVTESDLLVEKSLIDTIREQYPEDNFVTEEFNNQNTIKDRTWIIDPIDGTHHYMKNSIFWAIQLAFHDKGKIQFSIIYLPKLDEMYYGILNKGVYLNHKKLELGSVVPLNESIIEFCGSLHKKYDEKKFLFEDMLNNSVRPGNFMHINSCSVAFTNLISKRTDTLIVSTIKAWDILPGMFMVKELGFKEYEYEGMIVVSNTKGIDKFIN